MARYAAEGAQVTLVTCTLGEQGEVIPPGLKHLEAAADDALGPHRAGELAAALAELGVADHRLLAEGRWRDSGMAWTEPRIAGAGSWAAGPEALVNADLAVAASALAAVLREVRPQVVVTYDPRGGYGHPDHIKAHEIATAATDLVKDEAFVQAVYWIRVPRSVAESERVQLIDGGWTPASMVPPPCHAAYPPAVVDDDVLTTVIDGSAHLERKRAALRAHATQVRVEGDCFALSNGVAHLLTGVEAFQRVGAGRGEPWADDLFAVTQRHGR
ncbi:MAG: N-acetyl-1-D-myo-inositol-2-amino-2-deoxy-alpha-D-glucopyranoside deacetylase [Actinomycetota bacterium]|nr:N-acetyl-1-D-myo-inositol-2-amino-2-deoxy-alpha-D-glucopyranoside deacetylase [Actinomycetota bacterium]